MSDNGDIEALKTELADKEQLLADLDAGKVSLGVPFDDRRSAIVKRISKLKSEIKDRNSNRT